MDFGVFSFFKRLSKKQKIILLVVLSLFLVFSIIKTYFPQVGLSSWSRNINTIINGKPSEAETKDVCVYFIDVGQADCTLIKTKSGNFLIDAGKSVDAIDTAKYILSHNVSAVDYLVITHPHEDHFGGVATLLDYIEIKNIIMPQIPKNLNPDDASWDSLLEIIKEQKIPVYAARAGDEYKFDEAVFRILSPNKQFDNLNDMSVVVRLEYGETSFLFTGDIEKAGEKSLIRNYKNLNSDVLKVSHHGSSKGTSNEFLKAVNPYIAVISSGLKNDYGHPADDVLYRLKKNSVDYLRTDLNGNIIIGSDGEKLYCLYETGEKNS